MYGKFVFQKDNETYLDVPTEVMAGLMSPEMRSRMIGMAEELGADPRHDVVTVDGGTDMVTDDGRHIYIVVCWYKEADGTVITRRHQESAWKDAVALYDMERKLDFCTMAYIEIFAPVATYGRS